MLCKNMKTLDVRCSLYFQENPSEEDAAVVDKIMSSRIVKNEVIISFASVFVSKYIIN